MKKILANLLWLPLAVLAADTNEVPALIPAYGEIPMTFWERHQTVIIVAGFACLAFVCLLVKTMLRPESPNTLPPEKVARQELAKLQGRSEDGNILSEVSQILRRYVSVTFGLPATEMTTVEYCDALAAHETIGAKLAQMISSFLRVCDKDKFSPKKIAPPINAVSRVHELISLSEARLAQLASVNLPKP